ncbi:hypothetical protein D3C77_419520 [compost metagenome]
MSEDNLRIAHAAIVFGPVEKPCIVERGGDVGIRLDQLDGAVAPIDVERARQTQEVQVSLERQAVDWQRSVNGGVGVDAVVVTKHHVQVDGDVLPVTSVVRLAQQRCSGKHE